jgi:glutamate synthase domain-containing protein 2
VARFLVLLLLALFLLLTGVAAAVGSWAWLALAVLVAALLVLGVWDLLQSKHSVLRNYPVIGHLRYLLESIRPELQQYFVERNIEGRPFDRYDRSLIYQRAKGVRSETSFGTELDVNEVGYEFLQHSTAPRDTPQEPHRVHVGGPDCTQPYDMSLLNVSAMSFGALSGRAIQAMNGGAALGGFAQDTGEGGLTEHHLSHGGDLVWELGTAYFGARTKDGLFDADEFAEKSAHPAVKCVELKLSQGAKPGLGGVLPAAKVDADLARARDVKPGEAVVSPAYHRMFSTPRGLIEFLARMRELAGGKPVGMKLCVGSRHEVLAMCKAMLAEGTAPDFIVVDGAEGGTGAGPLEFQNRVGTPLTEGLVTMHNALVGTGLRDRVRIGASGKVATGAHIVMRLIQGADYTNAARAMMMATGCIQSQLCHTNTCPVGVATQDPLRIRALDVEDKRHRVHRYHRDTVEEAVQIIASMGLESPEELHPSMLRRVIAPLRVQGYDELYDWLQPGELLSQVPESWAADWLAADPDTFSRAQEVSR